MSAAMPPFGWVQLFELRTKKLVAFADTESAARYATDWARHGDIWIAAGRAADKTRRASTNVVSIPGLWADLDVNGGPDGKGGFKRGAAPLLGDAHELAHALLEPTLIVDSGYGIQPWWLFDEPWIFTTVEEREQAALISQAFQLALRVEAKRRSPEWGLDSTHDLARLMRLPGTWNHKGDDPVEVTLLDHDGPRHDLEALWCVAEPFMGRARASSGSSIASGNGNEIDISALSDADALVLADRLADLREIDLELDIVWTRRRSIKTAAWSDSQFDMSIATRLVDVDFFADREIAEAIRMHNRLHRPDRAKVHRVDYLQRTIAKAHQTHGVDQGTPEA